MGVPPGAADRLGRCGGAATFVAEIGWAVAGGSNAPPAAIARWHGRSGLKAAFGSQPAAEANWMPEPIGGCSATCRVGPDNDPACSRDVQGWLGL